MKPVPNGHGGHREGAGRPKKRANERQKPHTICATDKDWDLIKNAAHVIKHTTITDYEHTCFLLIPKEDYLRMKRLMDNEWLQEWCDSIHGKPPRYICPKQSLIDVPAEEHQSMEQSPLPDKPAISITEPQTLDEEEAVSLFLEYFRLNPTDASIVVQSKLDREQHLKRLREIHEEEDRVLARLNKKTNVAFKAVDDVNARVEQLLKFPGFRQSGHCIERNSVRRPRNRASSSLP